ncbi:MAG: MAPEG family protein [Pseudomonadota bacterium]
METPLQPTQIDILIVCIAANAALIFVLGLWVSLQRGATKTISFLAPLDPTSRMAKVQRAHGNSAEFSGAVIGVLIATKLFAGEPDTPQWMIWTGVAVTAARYLQAIGILTCETLEKPHPFKMIGSLITYVGGTALAVGLVA